MKMKLYVAIFLSVIFSDEVIHIPLDPIYHNNFFLNSIHPEYQPNLNDGYFIYGGLGHPLSVYSINDLYTNLNDSVRTNSSLLYEQGDVGYRNLYIDIKTKIEGSGILKLLANGLTYPGKYSQYTPENLLQNYLLHFSKSYDHSKISLYTGYHLENKDLKYINSNSGESYFSGIDYSIFYDKYEFDLKYATQIGQSNYSEFSDFYIMKASIVSKYHITEGVGLYIDNEYKDFYFDDSSYCLNNLSSGMLFQAEMAAFGIGVNYLSSNLRHSSNLLSIFPNIELKTKFDNFNISAGISSRYWTNPGTYNIYSQGVSESDMLISYGYSFLKMSYKSNNISINIEPRTVFGNDFANKSFSLNNKFELNYNMLSSETRIIPYLLSINKTNIILSVNSNHYNSSDLIVKNHINSSLKLLEIEGEKRYRKFIGIKYTGIQFNNIYSIDLDELSIYSNGNDWVWNDNGLKNYLDIHVGINFDKFIFSWHFTNVLSENYIINNNGNIYNLNMKYFTVQWNFDD